MSKEFRRERFGNNELTKFRKYGEGLPPPSDKKEDKEKNLTVFFVWIFLTLLSNILYTSGIGAIFSILNSSNLVTAQPGLKDIFLVILIIQLMSQWNRALRIGSRKNS